MTTRLLAEGQVAFVTGAGSGIGRSVAQLFAREGAAGVMVLDVIEPDAQQTVDLLAADGCSAEYRVVDVRDHEQVAAAVADTVGRWGRLDSAVNNAGISGPNRPLGECAPQEWHTVIGVNLDGVFNSMAAELAVMAEQGSGAIVNVSSGAAIHPPPGLAPYAASKAALIGLTRSAAGDYARRGVRINAVLPGPTRTALWDANLAGGAAALRRAEAAAPLGRLGRPHEIAEAIVWLCSDRASYVHGVDLLVDGGEHAFAQRG